MAKTKAARFPSLNDSDFPNLQNIDVYKYSNDFDYSRWQPDTKIRLVSVPWNSDYVHTVKFEDNAARDRWLDSLSGQVVELETDFKRYPENTLKIPLPYDIASRYNYMYLSLSEITSSEAPVSYESSRGVRRACYFIERCEYRSPNATELTLTLDVWTTYINDVAITSMILERGHAPAYKTDAETFLKNPKANCTDLLTADVNFGSADIVATHKFKPLADGEKWILFASTIPYSLIESAGVASDTGTSTLPTFADTSARYGYQYDVQNYRWAANGKSYTSAQNRALPLNTNDGNIPNGYSIYAIKAADLTADSMRAFQNELPHVLSSIAAAYVLPENLLTLGNSHMLGSFELFEVSTSQTIDSGNFELNISDFNFASDIKDFAKLYTFPYSKIEISDDNNNSFDLRIEDIDGDGLHVMQQLSVAYPFLKWNVLLDNVGGSGSAQVEFRNLKNEISKSEIFNSDIVNYLIEWQIPTYALFIDGLTYDLMRNSANAQQARANAITGYHQALRGVNTGRENTAASNSTAVTNTANSGTTSTANVNANIAASTSINTQSNVITVGSTVLTNAQMMLARAADVTMQSAMLNADTEAAALSATNNAVASAGQAAVGGIGAAASAAVAAGAAGAAEGASLGAALGLPGIAVGVGIGVLGALVSYGAANNSNTIAITNKSEHIAAANANSASKLNISQALNNAQKDFTIASNDMALSANSSAMRTINNNNVANANTIASNSANTSNSNATYSRNASVENSQDSLRMAQANYTAGANAAKLAPAIVQGSFTGDATLDAFGRRGIHARIKTQSASAINRAGDAFRRYGYMYGGFWNVQNLTCNKDYCYWLCSDIYIKDAGAVNNNANAILENIFKAGVTVWANPDQIGDF